MSEMTAEQKERKQRHEEWEETATDIADEAVNGALYRDVASKIYNALIAAYARGKAEGIEMSAKHLDQISGEVDISDCIYWELVADAARALPLPNKQEP